MNKYDSKSKQIMKKSKNKTMITVSHVEIESI